MGLKIQKSFGREESIGSLGKQELTKTSEIRAGRIQESKAKNYLKQEGLDWAKSQIAAFNFRTAYISFLKSLTSCTLLNLRTLLSWANKWGAGFKLWNKPKLILKQELTILRKYAKALVHPIMVLHGSDIKY